MIVGSVGYYCKCIVRYYPSEMYCKTQVFKNIDYFPTWKYILLKTIVSCKTFNRGVDVGKQVETMSRFGLYCIGTCHLLSNSNSPTFSCCWLSWKYQANFVLKARYP